VSFHESIISCLRTSFRGRASRSEFWYWTLFCLIVNVLTEIFDAFFFAQYSEGGPITLILSLLLLGPSLAVQVRRLHDIDRSGWWALLSLTVIGIVVLLYWALKKGVEDDNEYGAPQFVDIANRQEPVIDTQEYCEDKIFPQGRPDEASIEKTALPDLPHGKIFTAIIVVLLLILGASRSGTVHYWIAEIHSAGLVHSDPDASNSSAWDWYLEAALLDNSDAVNVYRVSAEDGDVIAQYYMGYFYSEGLGVSANDSIALSWFQKAADGGDVDAQYYLGVYYENGYGTGVDIKTAIYWYTRAAEQGDTDAENELNRLLAEMGLNTYKLLRIKLPQIRIVKLRQMKSLN
jgi:uncharacterized membrane protein YhaH (DUF805 family)